MSAISPKFAESLFKCHSELSSVIKDAKNPHFKSFYATINSVIDTLKPTLIKNGLFVEQPLIQSEKPNHVAIRTVIGHVSGETREFVSDMPVEGLTPQKTIAALTYLRRSVLVSLFMMGQEDDDGNAASSPVSQIEQIKIAATKNGWTGPDVLKLLTQELKKPSLEACAPEDLSRVLKCVSAYKPKDILK